MTDKQIALQQVRLLLRELTRQESPGPEAIAILMAAYKLAQLHQIDFDSVDKNDGPNDGVIYVYEDAVRDLVSRWTTPVWLVCFLDRFWKLNDTRRDSCYGLDGAPHEKTWATSFAECCEEACKKLFSERQFHFLLAVVFPVIDVGERTLILEAITQTAEDMQFYRKLAKQFDRKRTNKVKRRLFKIQQASQFSQFLWKQK